MEVLIVFSSSGRGLIKDAQILQSAIRQCGYECHQLQLPPAPHWQTRFSHYRHRMLQRFCPAAIRRGLYWTFVFIRRRLSFRRGANLVIHLENIRPSQLAASRIHWLIPNQEWFIESRTPYLPFVDRILCKTRHAVDVFDVLHPEVQFIGFTGSTNHPAPEPSQKNDNLALHVAGNSRLKGTETLVKCWSRHPEWPKLVVVSQHVDAHVYERTNLEVRKNLSDEALSALWSEARFAILPSEVEGYGQVLAEAMAFGCVTITTDAPPMNELVTPQRGLLVPTMETQKLRLGTRYLVSEDMLEHTINKALNADSDDLEAKSEAATAWFNENHNRFLKCLEEQLNAQLAQPANRSSQ